MSLITLQLYNQKFKPDFFKLRWNFEPCSISTWAIGGKNAFRTKMFSTPEDFELGSNSRVLVEKICEDFKDGRELGLQIVCAKGEVIHVSWFITGFGNELLKFYLSIILARYRTSFNWNIASFLLSTWKSFGHELRQLPAEKMNGLLRAQINLSSIQAHQRLQPLLVTNFAAALAKPDKDSVNNSVNFPNHSKEAISVSGLINLLINP